MLQRCYLTEWCVCVKVKLYLTSPEDQQSQNNSSAGAVELSGSASMLSPDAIDGRSASTHLSDFDYESSEVDEDLSETDDDDDDLWTRVSPVDQQSFV